MWSVWGDCTMTCGGGQRRRFRTCSNPAPKHNGRPCIGAGQDTERCNEIKCAGRFIYKEIVHMHTCLKIFKLSKISNSLSNISNLEISRRQNYNMASNSWGQPHFRFVLVRTCSGRV